MKPRQILERYVVEQKLLKQQRQQLREKIKQLKSEIVLHEQAREVVKIVSIKTQQQLQYHISDITSLALQSVFDNPYQLVVEFVERRNQTECDLKFYRDGMAIDPLEASGGGAVDVACFALRIASWSLQAPHSRPVIILDEPMRFVSEGLKERTSSMIKEISDKLKLQFIIITHDPKLTSYADKTFQVVNRKGVSHVKEIN